MTVTQKDGFLPKGSDLAKGTGWLAALRAYLFTIMIGNLFWETAQLPLYTIWKSGTFGEKTFAIVHCTGGDVLIALGALVIALVIVGHRRWPGRRFPPVAIVSIALGVSYTIFSEWLNIAVRKSWAYSDLMPIMHSFGFDVGISPLLQWIAVPLLSFWFARRRGMGVIDNRHS